LQRKGGRNETDELIGKLGKGTTNRKEELKRKKGGNEMIDLKRMEEANK
jgi:hypothetical protein